MRGVGKCKAVGKPAGAGRFVPLWGGGGACAWAGVGIAVKWEIEWEAGQGTWHCKSAGKKCGRCAENHSIT